MAEKNICEVKSEQVKSFDYSRKRTVKEIILFYIAGIITGVVIASCVKYLFAVTVWGETVPRYYYVVLIYLVSFAYTLAIALRILFCKMLWKNVKAISLAAVSVLMSVPFGLIIAFIPLAVLMGFEPSVKDENSNNIESDI